MVTNWLPFSSIISWLNTMCNILGYVHIMICVLFIHKWLFCCINYNGLKLSLQEVHCGVEHTLRCSWSPLVDKVSKLLPNVYCTNILTYDLIN